MAVVSEHFLYKVDKMPDFIFMLQFDNLQLCMWTVC